MKITIYGFASVEAFDAEGDPDWPLAGECSRCGEHHFDSSATAWVLPSEGGAERDLVVRSHPERALVNVGILHVYDKWLDADQAVAMANALMAAAELVRRRDPSWTTGDSS